MRILCAEDVIHTRGFMRSLYRDKAPAYCSICNIRFADSNFYGHILDNHTVLERREEGDRSKRCKKSQTFRGCTNWHVQVRVRVIR